ncbi:MAG TPA: nucleotidyltransferase family protein [Kiritimatiellia bacterium]|jgi:molybdenum cofactor cytidylyltransferase|nr:nucleotidyltransferase family protein [Lentisphaerota bacterium]HRV31032.1 nucleotidyltransferase family protein [Kiritimatiellia bacterium]
MQTVGIVLAAGASQRMGQPKALLAMAAGVPLAAHQAGVLHKGGCKPVAIVLGSEAETIRPFFSPRWPVVVNPRWAEGRATSLQAGIRAYPEAGGYLFMPVDAVGVKSVTIQAVLAAAEENLDAIWRPVCEGRKGNLLWLPREQAMALLNLPADARVDAWVQPHARISEVGDPGILANINTPEDWAAFLRSHAESGQ